MIREKDYLSWSQYSLWNTSKREYWKRYGLGEDRSQNKYFAKGRELGDALEHDDDGSGSMDDLLSLVVTQVPKLEFMEYKLEVKMKNGENLLSFLDTASDDGAMFYEYKSGKIPWTQEKVDKHDQMLFYALSLYILSERTCIPTSKLVWVETEQTETEGLKYTGLVEVFSRNFTREEIEEFEDKLIAAIKEIEEWEYLELDVEDEEMDRYIFLTESIKEMTAEADLIKLGIQVRMEADELGYASATNGKFSMSERKSWTYSPELTETAKEVAKQMKIAQAEEQKSGTAKCEVSKSLRFSLNKVSK
jgi:hypothetical protein